jgi:enoyl reductase
VQSFEAKLRRGDLDGFVPVHFPQALGNELAGVVDEVGEGVSDFAVGDDVLGFTTLNAAAEAVAVDATQVVRRPPRMSWEVAGALSASGQTAYLALKGLEVGEGDTVLIHAAAGGVGTVATQLARLWGATVIGTASEHNHEYLRSLGAIPVTYGKGLVERVRALARDGVDAALDAVGGASNLASIELVVDRSRVGTIVDYEAMKFGVRMLGGERSAAILAELAELHHQGKLTVHISKVVPIEEASEAHRQIETGHTRGRVVLTVG